MTSFDAETDLKPIIIIFIINSSGQMKNQSPEQLIQAISLPGWSSGMTLDCRAGGRAVVGSNPALAKQRIKFLGLLSLTAGVGL